MTKDTVFDMVLRELPVDAQRISIGIEATYVSNGKKERSATTGYFPSKAEASFRRETAKTEDAYKSLSDQVKTLTATVVKFEEAVNKRLRKLEKPVSGDVSNSVPDDESV